MTLPEYRDDIDGRTALLPSIDISGSIKIGDGRATDSDGAYTYTGTTRISHPVDISGLRIEPVWHDDVSANHIDITLDVSGIGVNFDVMGSDFGQSIRGFRPDNEDDICDLELTNHSKGGVVRVKTTNAATNGGTLCTRMAIGDSVSDRILFSRYPDTVVRDIDIVVVADHDHRITQLSVESDTVSIGNGMQGALSGGTIAQTEPVNPNNTLIHCTDTADGIRIETVLDGDYDVPVAEWDHPPSHIQFVDTVENAIIPVRKNPLASSVLAAKTTELTSEGCRRTHDVLNNQIHQIFRAEKTGYIMKLNMGDAFIRKATKLVLWEVLPQTYDPDFEDPPGPRYEFAANGMISTSVLPDDDFACKCLAVQSLPDDGITTSAGWRGYSTTTSAVDDRSGTWVDGGHFTSIDFTPGTGDNKSMLIRNKTYILTIYTPDACTTGKEDHGSNMRVVVPDGTIGSAPGIGSDMRFKERTVETVDPDDGAASIHHAVKSYPMEFIIESTSITGRSDDGNYFMDNLVATAALSVKSDYVSPAGGIDPPPHFASNFRRLGWGVAVEKIAGTAATYNMLATSPTTSIGVSDGNGGGGYVVAQFRVVEVVDGVSGSVAKHIEFDDIRLANYAETGFKQMGSHTCIRGGWGFICDFEYTTGGAATDTRIYKICIDDFLDRASEVNDGDPNGGQLHTERLLGEETDHESVHGHTNSHLIKTRAIMGDNEPNLGMRFDVDATANHVICASPVSLTPHPFPPPACYVFNMTANSAPQPRSIVTNGEVPSNTSVSEIMSTIHSDVSIFRDDSDGVLYCAVARQVVRDKSPREVGEGLDYILEEEGRRYVSSVNIYRADTNIAQFDYIGSHTHDELDTDSDHRMVGWKTYLGKRVNGDGADEIYLISGDYEVKEALSTSTILAEMKIGEYLKDPEGNLNRKLFGMYFNRIEFGLTSDLKLKYIPVNSMSEIVDQDTCNVLVNGNLDIKGVCYAERFVTSVYVAESADIYGSMTTRRLISDETRTNKIFVGGVELTVDAGDTVNATGILEWLDVSFNDVDISGNTDVCGNLYVKGMIRHDGTITNTSDDRVKHNERVISGATDTLMRLSPQIYDKSRDIGGEGGTIRESGLIAQDIWYDAPELRHLVLPGNGAVPVDYDRTPATSRDDPMIDPMIDPDYRSLGWGDETAGVNYTGLIAYLITSNQEISRRLDAKDAEVAELRRDLDLMADAHTPPPSE
jgi:hypothetical protein